MYEDINEIIKPSMTRIYVIHGFHRSIVCWWFDYGKDLMSSVDMAFRLLIHEVLSYVEDTNHIFTECTP